MRRLGYGLWLIAMIGLYLFENNAATRAILIASVLLPAVNVALARLFVKKIGLSMTVPDEAAKGETVEIIVSAVHLPVFMSLRTTVIARNRLTGEETTVSGACEKNKICFSVSAANCGLTEIACEGVAGDLFGLYGRRLAAEKIFVLIRPAIRAIQIDLQAEGVSSGESLLRSSGRLWGETVAIREYRAGDSVKMIHWKLSGKIDELMIRETGEPVSTQTAVVFDAPAFAGSAPEIISRGAELFFSISNCLLEKGAGHALVWREEKDGTVIRPVGSFSDIEASQKAFFAACLSKEAAPEQVWTEDSVVIRVDWLHDLEDGITMA